MYNKQDLLRMVFVCLLDGTIQEQGAQYTDTLDDLHGKVLGPFFKFIKKYNIFNAVECSSIDAHDLLPVLRNLVGIYQDLHGAGGNAHVDIDTLVELLHRCGVETRERRARGTHDVYLNKKIFDILRDVAE